MKVVWKNLGKGNKDKSDDIKQALADGVNAFSFLAEILEDRIEAARNNKERDNYDLENWALKQADLNGCIRTYKEILDIITGIDKRN